MTITEKEKLLEASLLKHKSAVIAFSGGVDSSLLLFKALSVLRKENIIAVTGSAPSYPRNDMGSAREVIDFTGATWLIVETTEFSDPDYVKNGTQRCFFCKKNLFAILNKVADERGIRTVMDGTIYDDIDDHRPGRRAALEAGVISPLLEAGVQKEEVRVLLKKSDFPNWDKPSSACLSSRVPYDIEITPEILSQVECGEETLRGFGFKKTRLRWHGEIARIEVDQEDMAEALKVRKALVRAIKSIGFIYVCLDMEGIRTGSMNEGSITNSGKATRI